jgi:hypothetical protein
LKSKSSQGIYRRTALSSSSLILISSVLQCHREKGKDREVEVPKALKDLCQNDLDVAQ